jgi:hypothetical protein
MKRGCSCRRFHRLGCDALASQLSVALAAYLSVALVSFVAQGASGVRWALAIPIGGVLAVAYLIARSAARQFC